ncbi:MAG: hypothetical protein AYK18_14295 [Theionarchaea archaeon DG-70]|nr:MAG: hypothetical protein AYK18_14295 [Theionarchaea archaeon DG-70]
MGNGVYIVDYDIPKDPPSKRVQFYRDLKEVNGQCNFSTMSVICTEEKELAEAVYWLVTAYGRRVNMYEGEEVYPV